MVVCPEDGGGLHRVNGSLEIWSVDYQKKPKIRPKKETIFRKGRDLLRSRILKIGPAGLFLCFKINGPGN